MKRCIFFLLPIFLVLFTACSLDEILGGQSETTRLTERAYSFRQPESTVEVKTQIAIQTEVSFFPPGTDIPKLDTSAQRATSEAATQNAIVTEVSFFANPTQTETPISNIITCPGPLPTRLRVGMNAEVTTSGLVKRLGIRPKPTLDVKKTDELQPGTKFVILDGPACSDNSYFWYVRTETGLKGWLREGDTDYWLDPLP